MSLLLVAIVHELDADRVVDGLREGGHGVTRIPSIGGYLRTPNATLLIGVEEASEPDVLAIIERECSGREVEVPLVMVGYLREEMPKVVRYGGATVFEIELRRLIRIRAEDGGVLGDQLDAGAQP